MRMYIHKHMRTHIQTYTHLHAYIHIHISMMNLVSAEKTHIVMVFQGELVEFIECSTGVEFVLMKLLI